MPTWGTSPSSDSPCLPGAVRLDGTVPGCERGVVIRRSACLAALLGRCYARCYMLASLYIVRSDENVSVRHTAGQVPRG